MQLVLGQNGIVQMVYGQLDIGQNGIGQNGMGTNGMDSIINQSRSLPLTI